MKVLRKNICQSGNAVKYCQQLIPFVYLDRLYFVSKENNEFVLYDDHKIHIQEPEEKALSVAKMAWENS